MMNTAALFSAVRSHALSLGVFDRVDTHEPKNAPGNRLVCAIYLAGIRPVPSSGVASTSGVLTLVVRIYKTILAMPEDSVDADLLHAVDVLFAAYSGDFTLGDTIRNVDLLGQTGTPLSATAGYLKFDDGDYRTVDITLPLIINDLWTQAP